MVDVENDFGLQTYEMPGSHQEGNTHLLSLLHERCPLVDIEVCPRNRDSRSSALDLSIIGAKQHRLIQPRTESRLHGPQVLQKASLVSFGPGGI